MKQMISFLLSEEWSSYDRFCGYGCWCFPDGSVDITAGRGPVLDSIDGTCFALHQCYKCLEHDGCHHQNTGYLLNAYIDNNGDRQIDCGEI